MKLEALFDVVGLLRGDRFVNEIRGDRCLMLVVYGGDRFNKKVVR
ncbi:MAG: hypothetical protein ACK48D_18620 [Pseudanabaena sp.]